MPANRISLQITAAAFFVLSTVLTAACGGSSTVNVVARPNVAPSPVQDCRGATETDPGYSASPGVTFHTLQVDGKLRDYRLLRPSTVDFSKPVPLVIVLHGSPADAQSFEDLIHFDNEAIAGKFMTAGPNGCSGYWSYAERGPYQADEDFIRQMINDLEARYPVDRSRIYVVGASAGVSPGVRHGGRDRRNRLSRRDDEAVRCLSAGKAGVDSRDAWNPRLRPSLAGRRPSPRVRGRGSHPPLGCP